VACLSFLIALAGVAQALLGRQVGELQGAEDAKAAAAMTARVASAEARAGAADQSANAARGELARTKAELQKLADMANATAAKASRVAGESLVAATYRWRLTREQRTRFLSKVPAGPNGDVTVTAAMGDTESREFAAQLTAMLREARFTVSEADAMFGGPFRGVLIRIHSRETTPEAARGLQRLFREIGIDAPGVVYNGIQPGKFDIVVGSRPLTPTVAQP
jgi:hypothetical protein